MTVDDDLIREYKLRRTELSKLHHLKRGLENEVLYWGHHKRKSDLRNGLKNKHQGQQQFLKTEPHRTYHGRTFFSCARHFKAHALAQE